MLMNQSVMFMLTPQKNCSACHQEIAEAAHQNGIVTPREPVMPRSLAMPWYLRQLHRSRILAARSKTGESGLLHHSNRRPTSTERTEEIFASSFSESGPGVSNPLEVRTPPKIKPWLISTNQS